MTFAIAPGIIGHFSQDETSGGVGRLAIFTRGKATTDAATGHRKAPALVAVPNVRGNTAPATDADFRDDVTGKLREGDRIVFTIEPLQFTDNKTEETSMKLLHEGRYYTLRKADDWHYAKGNRYLAYLDRRENGI